MTPRAKAKPRKRRKHVGTRLHAYYTEGGPDLTGYTLRVVDWGEGIYLDVRNTSDNIVASVTDRRALRSLARHILAALDEGETCFDFEEPA